MQVAAEELSEYPCSARGVPTSPPESEVPYVHAHSQATNVHTFKNSPFLARGILGGETEPPHLYAVVSLLGSQTQSQRKKLLGQIICQGTYLTACAERLWRCFPCVRCRSGRATTLVMVPVRT